MGERRGGASGGGPIVPPPPPHGAAPPRPPGHDPLTKLIPYDNPKALAAYYLAISALIPGVGLFTGTAAVVLGIQGLAAARARPEIKGRIHCWVGIILGGTSALAHVAGLVVIVLALLGVW